MRTDLVLDYLRRVLPGLRQIELSREAMTDWAGKYGHHFTTTGLLEWPPDVPKRSWMRVLKDAKDATNGQIGQEMKRAGLELVRAGSRVYIQPAGVQALPSSAARIVDFATGLTRGAEAPLSACGLSERARLRAIKLPDVKTLLTALGVMVERRAPRDGGIVLVRAV